MQCDGESSLFAADRGSTVTVALCSETEAPGVEYCVGLSVRTDLLGWRFSDEIHSPQAGTCRAPSPPLPLIWYLQYRMYDVGAETLVYGLACTARLPASSLVTALFFFFFPITHVIWILNMVSYNFCISTPILKLEAIIFVIHNCLSNMTDFG